MGWTYTYKPKGQSVVDFFRQRYARDGSRGHILDGAATLTEAYMAWQLPDGRVVALVYLLHYSRERGYNFGYKDMDEECGPRAIRCPERILDQLTPTDNPNAIEWRQRCRDYHATRREKRLVAGEVIRFTPPLRFKSGIELDLFAFEPDGRRTLFRSLETGCLYHVPDYKERDWTRTTIVESRPVLSLPWAQLAT
jgi:hypothetical protein